jgi:hypothetical protein
MLTVAYATQTRLRLERIDASEFATDGTLKVYASVVELEGNVVEDKAAPQFTLKVNGKSVGKPEKATRFSTAGEPLDLVLVVESSALYGPQKVVAPPPAPPPSPLPKNRKGAKAPKPPARTPGKRGQKTPPAAPTPSAPSVKHSGEEPLDKVKDAVRQLLESLSPKVRVLVIDYGGGVTPHPPFRPAPAASGPVDELSPDDESGDLRLTDALNAALVELNKPRADAEATPRKLIVVVSDGLNSQMDRKTFRALGDMAARKHVPIHTIAFSPNDERGPLLNLGELSKRSNGTFRWARNPEDLHNQIETLADELNKQYVLTFKLDLSSLEGKTFQLVCEDLVSNVFDPTGSPVAQASRRIPWWVWAAIASALLGGFTAFVLVRRGRRPKRRFPVKTGQAAAAPPPTAQRPAATAVPVAAAASPNLRGVIIIISGSLAGQRIPLGAAPVTVGKGPSTLQVNDDPTVSTRHAQIAPDRGTFVLTDLGSTNGTFVNNQKVTQPVRLSDGDLVRFGNTQIKFRIE